MCIPERLFRHDRARIRARAGGQPRTEGDGMIVFIAALIGAAYGAFAARRKGGKGWDVAHYAAAYGIAFSLVGVLATIIITRTMV